MMPAREDISDLRAGVRFWLFLNVWIAMLLWAYVITL